jgi:hypothetical protein
LKDFAPDFFSKASNGNIKSTAAANLKIEKIFNDEFPFLNEITCIEQMPGLNINSNNVKVTLIDGKYSLKSWGSLNPERINQICNLLLHLNMNGITAPIPIYTRHHRFIVERDKEYFTLLNFIDGEIFQPKFSDLSFYLSSINNLFLALETFDGNKNFSMNLDLEFISRTLVNLVSKNSSKLYSIFYHELDDLQSIIQRILVDIEKFSKIADVSKKQFSHFDLHPKNILELPNNKYAFLDFESCLYSDPNFAWGYTLIKILRQMMAASHGDLKPNLAGSRALDEVNKQEFATQLQVENLPIFGRIEIIRRLVFIIDQFEKFNSETWLLMLPVQIQTLKESYLLFPAE